MGVTIAPADSFVEKAKTKPDEELVSIQPIVTEDPVEKPQGLLTSFGMRAKSMRVKSSQEKSFLSDRLSSIRKSMHYPEQPVKTVKPDEVTAEQLELKKLAEKNKAREVE